MEPLRSTSMEPEFRDALYNQTVGKIHPQLVNLVHWDDFTVPLNNHHVESLIVVNLACYIVIFPSEKCVVSAHFVSFSAITFFVILS